MRAVSQRAHRARAASASRRAGADGGDGRGGSPARPATLSFTGAIIAGGSASRIGGRPKGLEIVGGARIIDRVAEALRAHCPDLLIAPGTLDASGWLKGAVLAPDVLPVKASITGIHAAISGATTDIVALAWDMPFVPPSLIAAMIARAGASANWSAVVPVVGGRPEPLCAAYSRRAAEPIADAVGRGLLRNGDILATLPDVVWLDEAFLKPFGDPAVMFFNVNAPSDLNRAEEIARTM